MSIEKELETKIQEFGSFLIQDMRKRQTKLGFRSAENALMNWALENEDLKINLFRLVDTLPSLHSSSDIARHIREYFADQNTLSSSIRYAANFSSSRILSPFVALAAKSQVKLQSKRFIAGESPNKSISALKKIRKRGLSFTIDLLGEAALNEEESRVYSDRYLELIQALNILNQKWQNQFLANSHPEDQNLINISIKLSSLYSQTKAIDFENSVTILKQRLSHLFRQVKEVNGVAYVDMEDSSLTDITLQVVKEVLLSDEFKSYPGFGFVLQAYLRRTPQDVEKIIGWIKQRGTSTKIRLVKGAYWDSEFILSKQKGWACPVFIKKEHSDAAYEVISKMLLDAGELIYPAFASHNIRSLSHAINYATMIGKNKQSYELQFLYGMGDELKESLNTQGFLCRDYTPIGELLPGMAYLVRRLLENTANEGFLRQVNFEKVEPASLLKKPQIPTSEWPNTNGVK